MRSRRTDCGSPLRLSPLSQNQPPLGWTEGVGYVDEVRALTFHPTLLPPWTLAASNPHEPLTLHVLPRTHQDTIKKYLCFPPGDDQLVVMCGPPIFEKMMCGKLDKLGFPRKNYFSYSNPE